MDNIWKPISIFFLQPLKNIEAHLWRHEVPLTPSQVGLFCPTFKGAPRTPKAQCGVVYRDTSKGCEGQQPQPSSQLAKNHLKKKFHGLDGQNTIQLQKFNLLPHYLATPRYSTNTKNPTSSLQRCNFQGWKHNWFPFYLTSWGCGQGCDKGP